MKIKINILEYTLHNLYLLPINLLFFSSAILLVSSHVLAENAVLRSLFSCQAQGLGGVIPTINISYQQGTNLSFIPSGEIIRKIWLNDPSQVTMDFDGQMCVQFAQDSNTSIGDCKNSAANVIQLRRIKKLEIPGLPNADNTLLTVVTEGKGKKKLYTFRVLYEEGSPEYHTLAIFPDPPSARELPCVRTLIEQ